MGENSFVLGLPYFIIFAGLIYLIIRSIRKDKADGRGFMGGPKSEDKPPIRKN